MTANLFFGLRWGVFLLRWLAYTVYRVLLFVSKPGSCVIIPTLLAAAAYAGHAPLESLARLYLIDRDWRRLPEPVTQEAGLAIGILLLLCAFRVLPRVLLRLGWLMSLAGGMTRLAVRLTIVLGIAALGMAWYYRLPLNANLPGLLVASIPPAVARYLPSDLAAYIPASVPDLDWRNWQWRTPDSLPLALHAGLAVAVVLVGCGYVMLSRIIEKLLGAFPPASRPLPPLRSLKVKARRIRSVVVRSAVPPLPRRRRAAREEPESPFQLSRTGSAAEDGAREGRAFPDAVASP